MSSVKKGLGELKEYALSDSDIRKILGDDISIFTYPDLEHMNSIDEAFDSKGRAIILFPNMSPTMGHWCCMLNQKKGILFWDPYGEAPEEQKDGLSKDRLAQLDMDQPLLMRLLRASGRPVYYNTHQYQKMKDSVATCGRWCVTRCLYAPKSEEYFKKVVDASGMEPDDFVSALTANFLKK